MMLLSKLFFFEVRRKSKRNGRSKELKNTAVFFCCQGLQVLAYAILFNKDVSRSELFLTNYNIQVPLENVAGLKGLWIY